MAGEGRKATIAHVAALDGARGAAVAGVLLFHGGHLRGGYLGVDFFFTLSGFLITSLLLAESTRTGSIRLGAFWARRARRLLPALAVLMIGVALYCSFLARPDELTQIRGDAFATLAYAANWRAVYAHQDYWAIFRAPSPLDHTWSLAIEEQFYVLWPLLFVGAVARWKRAAPQAVLAVSLALASVSSVLMIVLYDPANSARDYYGTDTRAAAILFGASLAAYLVVRGPAHSHRTRVAVEAAGLAGFAVLAIAWCRLDGQSSTLYRGGFLVCGIAATAVIAAAVHPTPSAISRVLSFRPLCLLGLISYGVYLYHWPIDVVLSVQRVHLSGWPLFIVQTAVTLAIAIASYRVIEQPIRRGALSNIHWRALTPAIAFALVVALVVTTNGAHSDAVGQFRTASAALHAADTAARTAPPTATRIMLVGNSVAYTLGPGFRDLDATPPLVVFDAGRAPCQFPPIIDSTPSYGASKCHPPWEVGVLQRFRPTIVFWIVSDASSLPVRLTYRGQTVKPCSEPYDSLYRQSGRDEMRRLAADGAKVIMTTEPYLRVAGAVEPDRVSDCNNRLRHEVASETGTQLVDLFGYICPHGVCRVKQDGVTLRPDGQHFTGPGGDIVARWLLDQARHD